MHHRQVSQEEIELLREVVRYDYRVGKLYWKIDTLGGGKSILSGSLVNGHVRENGGHINVGICGQLYRAHHLAWMLHTGKAVPDGYEIHHKDGDPANNRWYNLEAVTRKQHQTYAKEDARTRNLRLWQTPSYRAARAAAFTRPDVIAKRTAANLASRTPEVMAKCQTPEARAKRAESMRRSWTDPSIRARRMKGILEYHQGDYNGTRTGGPPARG